MKARIAIALRLSLVTLVLTGIVYPLLITGVATVLFPNASAGSLVYDGDRAIGSELIGQSFTGEDVLPLASFGKRLRRHHLGTFEPGSDECRSPGECHRARPRRA